MDELEEYRNKTVTIEFTMEEIAFLIPGVVDYNEYVHEDRGDDEDGLRDKEVVDRVQTKVFEALFSTAKEEE